MNDFKQSNNLLESTLFINYYIDMDIQQDEFKRIGEFYQGGGISQFWELIHDRQMHVAYFPDDNNDSIAEGSNNLTSLFLNKTKIRKDQYFFDCGCGFGIFAIKLAISKGCNVSGITASEYQKKEADKIAIKEDINHKVKFQVADALNMPFDNEQFDGGCFFESIFHMGHREALKEACRVLKSGANLLIADFIVSSNAKQEDINLLSNIFHIKSLLKYEDYPMILSKTGFKLINITDISKQTIGKRTQKYNEAFKNYEEDIIQMGENMIKKNGNNISLGKDVINFNNGKDFYKKFIIFWNEINQMYEKTACYGIIEAQKI
jgi:ubiquinone/menaquinone biosynthesis C-methylase UbiE